MNEFSSSECCDDFWFIKTLGIKNRNELYFDEKSRDPCKEDFKGVSLSIVLKNLKIFWEERSNALKSVWTTDINLVTDSIYRELEIITQTLIEELSSLERRFEDIKEENFIDVERIREAWNSCVNDWRNDVKALERRMFISLRELMGEYLKKMVDAKKIREDIVDVMVTLCLELNQIILGNVQNIAEIEIHLKLIFEAILHKWLIELNYQNIMLHEDSSRTINIISTSEEQLPVRTEVSIKTDEILTNLSEMVIRTVPPLQKSSEYISLLIHLENCVQHIRTTECKLLDLLHLERHVVCPKDGNVRSRISIVWGKLDDAAWENPRDNLTPEKLLELAQLAQKFFDDSEKIIYQGVNLWNDHIERLETSKSVIELKVSQNQSLCANGTRAIEGLLNTTIDTLRQAPTMYATETTWNDILKILKNLEKSVSDSYVDEMEVWASFEDLGMACNDIMITAMDLFTETHSTFCWDTPAHGSEDELFGTREDPDDYYQTLKTVILKSGNWVLGYLESFRFLRSLLETNADAIVSDWIEGKREESYGRYQRGARAVERRKERIRSDILEVRAFELQVHNQAMSRHIEGIDNAYSVIKTIDEELKRKMTKLYSDFEAKMRDLANLKPARDSHATILKHIYNISKECDIAGRRRTTYIIHAYEEAERRFMWIEQSCIAFLNTMKLFSEGGNFTVDELLNGIHTIERVTKDLPKHKKITTAKIAKNITLRFSAFYNLSEKMQEEMKKLEYEATLALNIKSELHRVRRALKREVYNGKCFVKKVEEKVNVQCFSETIENWHDLSKDIKECYKFLHIPRETTLLELESIIGTPHGKYLRSSSKKVSRRYTNDKRRGTKDERRSVDTEALKKKSEKRLKLRSFRGTLGPRNTKQKTPRIFKYTILLQKVKHPAYLYNTKLILQNSLVNMVQKIVLHYSRGPLGLTKKKRPSISKETKEGSSDKMKKDSTTFEKSRPEPTKILKSFHKRYINYNIQCETAWLHLIYDFLCLVCGLRSTLKKYILDKYDTFENKYIQMIDAEETFFLRQVEDFEKEGLVKRNRLELKLKPWHGHPSKKPLLNEVKTEVLGQCRSEADRYIDMIRQYNDDLSNVLDNFTSDAEQFGHEMDSFIESILQNDDFNYFLFPISKFILRVEGSRHPRGSLQSPSSFDDTLSSSSNFFSVKMQEPKRSEGSVWSKSTQRSTTEVRASEGSVELTKNSLLTPDEVDQRSSEPSSKLPKKELKRESKETKEEDVLPEDSEPGLVTTETGCSLEAITQALRCLIGYIAELPPLPKDKPPCPSFDKISTADAYTIDVAYKLKIIFEALREYVAGKLGHAKLLYDSHVKHLTLWYDKWKFDFNEVVKLYQ